MALEVMSLTEGQQESIRQIQTHVKEMLEERAGLPPEAQPSRYWMEFASCFDYMLDLAPRAFAKLGLHTYHLTGNNYQTYYFGTPEPFLSYWGSWLDVRGLPPEHVLTEPDEALNLGFRLDDGRLVNQDIARFQRSIATLSRRGILKNLSQLDSPAHIVEIGGGYGGFAHHLSRIVGRVRYVLIDLPETLLFSAAYLTLHAPERRLYLYRPGEEEPPGGFEAFDFILMPDYRLDRLNASRFDLAVNLASMQEMRVDQVERYLDFLRETCSGPFYSCNRDRQNRNDEMPGLFELMRTRFDLEEIPALPIRPARTSGRATLRRLASVLGLVSPPAREPFPFVEHLGLPSSPHSSSSGISGAGSGAGAPGMA